jgi:chromosome segregation protein
MRRGAAREALMKSELSRERAVLGAKRAKLRKAEKRREEALRIESESSTEIARASQDMALLEGTAQSERRRIHELKRELKITSERRRTLASTLRELARHLDRLLELKKNERERLSGIDRNVRNRESLVGKVADEIDELTGLIERVRGAIVQAETKEEIVKSIADEERAVQKILGLKENGLVDGVLGELSDLITVNDEDRVAVEAASDGWLRAVIVKDLKTALICAEALKNDKLGRTKLIPLSEVDGTALNVPEAILDKVKRAMDIVSYDVGIEAAICKVFGDTVVASTRVDAIEASRKGLRAVTSEGEVFEPSGGIVGGYYRRPTDILSLLPPGDAIERLEANLSKLLAFQEQKRRDYAERLRDELSDLAIERAQTEKGFQLVDKEAKNIRTEVERITKSLQVTASNIRRIKELIEETNADVSQKLSRRNLLRGQISILGQRLKRAQGIIRSTDLSVFTRDEGEASKRVSWKQEALVALRNQVSNSLRNLKAVHEPAAKRIRGEMIRLREQNRILSSKIREYEHEREGLKAESDAMVRKREEISQLIGEAREKRRVFEVDIQQLSKELEVVNHIVEVRRDELGKLTIEAERAELQESDKLNELRQLGYESPLQVTVEELSVASRMLGEIEKEIQIMGPVNLLAIEQYGQQYKNYKMLSVRRNELEAERMGIVRFMDEIESKKRQAFMQALEKINASFGQFFEKITSGKAWLQLENVEDPFSGGLDMFVQFPSKSPRLVSAVSGGEKSVSALCFIFAMQELKPAPFYVMDEVDAHLDPMNTERFAELVRERSASSQMIVITLRDVVASKAHRIFGAYINKGTTQLVEMPQRRGEEQ